MDRVINYSGSIPRSVDLLQTNRNVMTAIGMLAQEMFGTSTTASGFGCTPTSPATLSVLVAPGRLYSLQATDPLQYSTLPADTTDLIVKQGILNTSSTLACPAPATSGQSVNYLIEVAFEEIDTNPVVLPYYNSANPSQPFSGPNNSGSANYTSRQDTVLIQAKAGTPATTGTQVTPAPDAGYVGLWVVTVAYGQTTITSGNISQYSGAPLLGGGVLQAIQSNLFTYAPDIGSANAYAANFSPAITTLVDGMQLEFQAAFANTGASTFAPNGVGAQPLVGGAHAALQGGEIAAGSKCVVMWKANINSWVLLESTGGAIQIAPGTKSNQAVNLGQFLALLSVNGYIEVPVVVAGVQKTFIMQWGAAPNSDGTGKSVATWPLPFPNSCLLAIPINGAGSAPGSWAAVGALTTTTGTFWSASASGVAASGQAVYYVAIGY
ncbi:gp53-like domain-containing protein [Burkholderia multivorans]|uniref:gp53-like domain-containing protein n=1 Tax=Burkholderia multivorans TaxID=87883 RepID=UPI0021C194AF|nr:hypothetical protein [Burkholderia multivorans]MDR9052049.1 hypothetical protein [Burkholderia multivorans]MDR9060121.1 hypothetical protein [Burkholderia multivorans]MDR9062426.1 hypothetical protein [Burkholderia multivorans]MDR9076551.1 hypothetical protein [Burkholderia multivorans]MDR9081572.1 hypothetical protein [Burkholderia multivorans]